MQAFNPNSPLSPDQYAGLDVASKSQYLIAEAQYYQSYAANGGNLTQSQADFVTNILKNSNAANSGSVAGNPDMNVGFLDAAIADVSESVGSGVKGIVKQAGSSVAGFEWKIYLPIIVIAVVAIFLMNSYGKNVNPLTAGK